MAGRDVAGFVDAGRTLYSLGLVKGSEGNLSTFDGRIVRITRTGAKLDRLEPADLVDWTPEAPTERASSDLEKHLTLYREHDARAVVHAHPPGSVPEGWTEGEPHGVYAHGLTLDQAFASAAHASRDRIQDDRSRGDGSFVRLVRPVEFEDHGPLGRGDRTYPHGAVRLIDQTLLPAEERYRLCGTVEEVAGAIRRLAVRGAPVLGIAAAYAMVLAARGCGTADRNTILHELDASAELLVGTRPTAVNIRWGVERVLARVRAEPETGPIPDAALDEARRIEVEDAEACSAIGRFGAELVPEKAKVLTHCNTGMLCTAGIGTAQGVIHRAHLEGKGVHVWVDETRPVWQGARLTAWELSRLDVPFTLIADAAAASLMAGGKVDLVITGADRIASDGSVANKVGTYGLAVLASHHGIPFHVAAPTSTIDLSSTTGADIPIEERDQAEVTAPFGLAVAPRGTVAFNPAFDLTPAGLVSSIVTERGVVRPPFEASLRRLLDERISA